MAERTLEPTFDDILRECGRLRILAVGKSGVGKTSLIKDTFKVPSLAASHHERGISDIRKELTSGDNTRFVMHDSQGYEPGETKNYSTLKAFIEERSRQPRLADRLHVIWLCIAIPFAGGRVFEIGTEELLKLTSGSVPVIVVFTKFDELVLSKEVELLKKNPTIDDDVLDSRSRAEADKDFEKLCADPLEELISRSNLHPLPYVKVSVKSSYQDLLSELVKVTEKHITESVSTLLMAIAQRVDVESKINVSIAVGRKKYWRGLASSTNFPGFSLHKCLHVLHTDIVNPWNFSDPEELLLSQEFEGSITRLVDCSTESLDSPTKRKKISAGLAVAGTFAGVAGAVSGPAAPIVTPTVFAGVLFAHWVYESYKTTTTTLLRLMGYIVHLTNVMQSVFHGMQGNSVSKEAVQTAVQAYATSQVSSRVRDEIDSFVKGMKPFQFTDRDFVLDELIRLIQSHRFPPAGDIH